MGNTRWQQVTEQSTSGTSTGVTFTVPSGKAWRLQSIFATLTAGATTGNRRLSARAINSSAETVGEWHSGNTLSSGLVGIVHWAVDHPNDTVFDAERLMLRALAGDFVLPAGYALKVLDSTGISSADTLAAKLLVEEMIA